jgi:hypothetical protein
VRPGETRVGQLQQAGDSGADRLGVLAGAAQRVADRVVPGLPVDRAVKSTTVNWTVTLSR